MSTPPKRVRKKRVKGWKMPLDGVYVGRPGKWGNPVLVGSFDAKTRGPVTAAMAVERFREKLNLGMLPFTKADVRRELRGKDLACWCALDEPCHADVLLEIANSEVMG